ncbi:hypothetical protein PCE1_000104 [Barthelona sp. PCE]
MGPCSSITVPRNYLQPHSVSLNHNTLKAFRKKVRRGRIAPFFPPSYVPADGIVEKCMICRFNYASLNICDCCHENICSECYAVQRQLHGKHNMRCPFCRHIGFKAHYKPRATVSQLVAREQRETNLESRRIRAHTDGLPVYDPNDSTALGETKEAIERNLAQRLEDVEAQIAALSPNMSTEERSTIIAVLRNSVYDR